MENKLKYICDGRNHLYGYYDCKCGKIKLIKKYSVDHGFTKSCGCKHKNRIKGYGEHNIKHGLTGTREYEIWSGIKKRCRNKNHHAYNNYGGRGIKVCDRWFDSFENFLEDMGKIPDDKDVIDRINNDGNYEPENCRWVTYEESDNNKRNNIFIEYNNKRQTIRQWEKELNFPCGVLWNRINDGWAVEDAIITPIQNNRRGRIIEYKGEKKTILEWSKILNINYSTLYSRIYRGKMSIKEVFGYE